MRDIKFRAWDKASEYFPCIREDADYMFGIDTDGTIFIINNGELCDGDYDIEQFTGLQDKNGVDIYEGDILETDFGEVDDDGGRVVCVEQVVWVAGMFTVMDNRGITGLPLGECALDIARIIGNIHENPDLLK